VGVVWDDLVVRWPHWKRKASENGSDPASPEPFLTDDGYRRPACDCFARPRGKFSGVAFHTERQDTECDAWQHLLALVEEAAADQPDEFAPLRDIDRIDHHRIVTLPATIAKLTSVRRLQLYGSHLVRIPPEIGEMRALTEFHPYTSYRLHWFPYEIIRCTRLARSTVSTRALYGNYKFRPPFPRLDPGVDTGADATPTCSVCRRPMVGKEPRRVWISQHVGNDVLPLLVNACSRECIRLLPKPPNGYIQRPHGGGKGFVEQPPATDYPPY
jgi:hypothetical protein